KGRELAHVPGQGLSMVGSKGAQLLNLPKGTSVLPNRETESLIKMGIPGYEKGIGGIWSWIFKGAKTIISKINEKFNVPIPKGEEFHDKVPKGAIEKSQKSVGDYIAEKLGDFGFDMGSGKVKGNVAKWIRAAMAVTNSPDSWFGPLTTIAMKESGGKTGPSTINKWDINWLRGTPSMGLMQTIGPTFNAYKKSGMNDIMNPVHNAVAAINYIKSRYGNPFNTPGIASMARGGPYKGYAKGGIIDQQQLAML